MGQERKNAHLAAEKSAYLQQHVDSLVEWYPWGEEALAKAKAENRLILLSIGAATCHTCYRMEEETYRDAEVAACIHQNYVPILVDKDERPDIEAVYMLVVQGMTKRAGLPMTVIMTPDQEPFFAATYLPLKGYQNVPGTSDMFPAFAQAWKENPGSIQETAREVTRYMKEFIKVQPGEKATKQMLRKGRERLELIYDMVYGGFGPAPKFLMPHNALFLMRYGAISEDREAFSMVQKTFMAAYQGGIYDHLGGGFMHYSTDPVWMIPSFEKLAGDNAMMAVAFLQAAKYTEDSACFRIAREILDFLCRDLCSPEGAFYHGIGADSEGEEGVYYGWSKEQIQEVLDFEGEMFQEYYNIDNVGKLPNGTTLPNLLYQELDEKRILYMKKYRKALLEKRQERVQPLRDEKILASNNGFVIGALAYAWQANGQAEYLEAAKKAADFVIQHMIRPDGRLVGCYYDETHQTQATAIDYAAMIWGLTELQQASWDSNYFPTIVRLQDDFIKYFWDEQEAGFFVYAHDAESLMLRPKRFYDAELPCENSLATYNLMRLGYLCGRKDWHDKAGAMLHAFGGEIMQNPTACSFWLYALCFWLSPGNQVYVFGERDNPEIDEMKQGLKEFMMIEWYSLLVQSEEEKKKLEEFVPALKNFEPNFEKGEAYIGRGFEYAKKGVEEAESLGMGLSNYTYEPCL